LKGRRADRLLEIVDESPHDLILRRRHEDRWDAMMRDLKRFKRLPFKRLPYKRAVEIAQKHFPECGFACTPICEAFAAERLRWRPRVSLETLIERLPIERDPLWKRALESRGEA
jgi:hypothetical protein